MPLKPPPARNAQAAFLISSVLNPQNKKMRETTLLILRIPGPEDYPLLFGSRMACLEDRFAGYT